MPAHMGEALFRIPTTAWKSVQRVHSLEVHLMPTQKPYGTTKSHILAKAIDCSTRMIVAEWVYKTYSTLDGAMKRINQCDAVKTSRLDAWHYVGTM